ncbi:MAG: MFS transporter [Deltaproteobacteria bacterium]|nr:MFS transporter [Deltaproteobacteria bacterium]
METRALLILTSLNLLDYLDRYLIASLGSLVKAEMGLSDKAFGFLGTAFFLVYFLSSPVFGYLGDRFGRIRLMAGGAVLWSMATSLTFWVTTYPTLVLARGLVGVGEASFGTLSPAYLADILPLGRRSRALGIFYVAIPLGSALAYLAGGFIGGHFGWRPAFLLGGLPGLLLAAAVFRLPATPPLPSRRAASAADIGPRFLSSTRTLLKIPTLLRLTLGYGMITFALGGLAFWMPRYLEVAKGLTLTQANYLLFGSVTVAGGLGTLAGGFLGDRLLRYTPRAPLWVSGLGVALAVPLAGLTIFSRQPVLYVPALVLSIFLLFLNPGVITSVIVSISGPVRRARAVALNIVVIHLVGDVPSPFLIGWASDRFNLQWGVSLTIIALALAVVFIMSALRHLVADLAKAGELESAAHIK